MKTLTDAELNKLSTHRLINILRIVQKHYSNIAHHYGRRCCEMCHEYVGDDWEKDVGQYLKPSKEYMNRIKAVLETRSHCDNAHKPRIRKNTRWGTIVVRQTGKWTAEIVKTLIPNPYLIR